MILTAKQKYRLFLIVLLICFSGCTAYQKNASPRAVKKDEWFAKDKAKHFSASFLIGTLTYSIARAGEADKDDASIIGFSFSSTCGIAKEINDEVKHNDWSYKDLIWDFIGGGVGVSVSNILD
jgi:putative lipoprotein